MTKSHSADDDSKRTHSERSTSRDGDGTERRGFGWARLAVTLGVLALLVAFAAGFVAQMLNITAVIAALGLIVAAPPVTVQNRALWWTGIVTFALLAVTLVPIPVNTLGPRKAEYFREADELLSRRPVLPSQQVNETSEADSDQTAAAEQTKTTYGRLTLNRAGTHRFIVLLSLFWSLFWVTASMGSVQRRRVLRWVLVGGTVVAVLGMLGSHVFPVGNRVWWLIDVNYDVGGQPFINKNHFASFCAMLVPLSLCFLMAPDMAVGRSRRNRRSKTAARSSSRSSRSSSAGEGASGANGAWLRWWFLASLAALVAAVVLSGSRGGILAMLVGALAATAFWLRGHPFVGAAATVVAVGVMFAVVFWPSTDVQERLDTLGDIEQASPYRLQMWQEAVSQWRDFPLIGGGIESFRVLYGLYRSEPGRPSPEYVENEYLQLLSDAGALGGLCVVALALCYLACLYKSVLRRSSSRHHGGGRAGPGAHVWLRNRYSHRGDQQAVVMAAISAGALAVLLLHFFFDFPTRAPLNAALAGVLLGTGMPLPERSSRRRRAFWHPRTLPYVAAAVAVSLIGWGQSIRLDRPTVLRNADTETVVAALRSAPTYWYPWYRLTRTYMTAAGTIEQKEDSLMPDRRRKELWDFGMDCFRAAARYNPLNPDVQFELAKSLHRQVGGMNEEVRETFRRALRYASGAREPYRRDIWQAWMERERLAGGLAAAWTVAEEVEEMSEADGVRVWKHILSLCEQEALRDQAYEAIRNVTRLDSTNYNMLLKQSAMEQQMGDLAAAAESLHKASQLKPDKYSVFLRLGEVEMMLGNTSKARQALSQAVYLRPGVRRKADEIWNKHVKQQRDGTRRGPESNE